MSFEPPSPWQRRHQPEVANRTMTGQVFHRDIDHSADLADLDSLELLEIEVDQGMEMALQEMESLSKQLGDVNGETLVELCRENIINTVVGQLGLNIQVQRDCESY